MRKTLYSALVTALVALNAALFFWRRSGRPTRRRSMPTIQTPPIEPVTTARSANPIVPAVPTAQPSDTNISKPAATTSTVTSRTKESPRVPDSLDTRLFVAALIVFLLTRFIGLDQWPVYFFTDEAIQTVQAANLVHHGFRDTAGNLLPTFFQNGTYYNLSVSVYAQVIPYLLFGFSEIVTRGISVLVALSGAAAIGFILRDIFKVRHWWIGTLIISITPAFFLHSRTAFETIFGTSLYAWFLYFYLRYRTDRPRMLWTALVFGALAFYAYSPMQAVVVATGGLLLLSDACYHLKHGRVAAVGIVVLVVAALPYLRFQAAHPDESFLHLRTLNSYLTDINLTSAQKVTRFIQQYAQGISPAYWFSTATEPDLIRHLMKGYGRLSLITLPFLLIGLIIAVRRLKDSAHRAIILVLFATPLGGALANDLQVYRMLALTVPAAILSTLGAIWAIDWLTTRTSRINLAVGSFALLSLINGYMTYDALTNGATWYNDYHMGGLQYGGPQIFAKVRDILQAEPDTHVLVSPTWANGTDVLLEFFMPDESRVTMGNIDAFKLAKLELNDQMLLVMTAEEYRRTKDDPKFEISRIEQTIPYPDGSDGFYFVRLHYSAQADALFAAEDAARRQPVREDIVLNDGVALSVLHSQFDGGQLRDLFDGDTFTLARTSVDNPALIEITFAIPQPMTKLILTTATMDFNVNVTLTLDNGETQHYSRDYLQTGTDPTNDFTFEPPPTRPVKVLRLEIKDLGVAGDSHVHIREIKWQ